MDYESYKDQGLSITVENGIATTIMTRKWDDYEGMTGTGSSPNARNTQHRGLTDIWRDFAVDPDVRVVLLTGVDDEFYLSVGRPGARPTGEPDLKQMWEWGSYMTQTEVRALYREMINFDKPVIAAVNGATGGSGLTVVMLSDISIVADDAWLFDPHIMLGISAGDGAGGIWPLYSGIAKAKLYLLTSDAINGKEADRIGLVSRSVPREDLQRVAADYAERLARYPEVSLRFTKRGINQWLQLASLVSQEYALTLQTLSRYSGEQARNPHTEWPPRQVP